MFCETVGQTVSDPMHSLFVESGIMQTYLLGEGAES